MRKLTEAELTKADAIEVARTAINLRHRLAARRERNDVLADLSDRIDEAIVGGKRLEITAASLFNAAFESESVTDADNS